MRRLTARAACALLLALPASAAAQMGEFGDAPEGALAYPASGVIGFFPTCKSVGPAGWIQHGPIGGALFPGPVIPIDFEMEGNAGLCPLFGPYDADDCFNVADAGLLFPPAYTIRNGVVVPCDGISQGTLGAICTVGVWGTHADMRVVNMMPVVGYVNVIVDWDQNGVWGGSAICPGGPVPEHILINHPVPMGYVGTISGLAPPNFGIGPNQGPVWARFTVAEGGVSLPWDGSGGFEDGESEDHLLVVDRPVLVAPPTWGLVKQLYR